ncbi:HD domain-containing protein [Endozoicomonas sp. 2B-B]
MQCLLRPLKILSATLPLILLFSGIQAEGTAQPCRQFSLNGYGRDQSKTMQNCLNDIKAKASVFYQQQDPYHNLRHGERVVKYALKINQYESGNSFLVEAGAWLHQYHDHLEQLDKLLKETGLNPVVQSQLYEIVRLCRPHLISGRSPLEAKIVFDADAMDLMGARGIARELACNLEVRKLPYDQALMQTRRVQNLFEEKLMTETGRSMAQNDIKMARLFWRSFDESERPL